MIFKDHCVAKPKIDLLLKEINEVRNRENEYLVHIRTFYPDKYIKMETDVLTDDLVSKPLNDFIGDPENGDVNKQMPLKVNKSQSAKKICCSSEPINSNPINSSTVPVSTSYKHRIFQSTSKKGIMHQFYTSRGKISKEQCNANNTLVKKSYPTLFCVINANLKTIIGSRR